MMTWQIRKEWIPLFAQENVYFCLWKGAPLPNLNGLHVDVCMWVKGCVSVLGGVMRRWMFVCGYIGSRARLCRKVCIGKSVPTGRWICV